MWTRMLSMLVAVAATLQTPTAQAAGYADLAIVKPIMRCNELATINLAPDAGAPVALGTADLKTPAGEFCKVSGELPSGYGFEVYLPAERWTQRLVQSAQGNLSLPNAGTCGAATNGEFVVAINSRGGSRRREGWQTDPEKRIAFAYLLNHQTALIAKRLIRAFYGQPQRYAYFVGCSGGGREVLIEAQRFPDDFDGIAAGAPALLLNVHNGGFFHGWERHVNRRRDGSAILLREHLPILHRAVLDHCSGTAQASDGILQMPTACTFNPAWVRCRDGAAQAKDCLTAEETDIAQRLYRGAADRAGVRFDMGGFPLGSEMFWPLTTPADLPPSRTGSELRYLLPMPEADQSAEALDAAFRFDAAWFGKLDVLAPLYNGANTDLRPFLRRGGKVLLWHGAADVAVQQQVTIAYYQGVQRLLGRALTDSFMRLFLLPGVAHCGGGEGPSQIDVLSPLMTWVESGQAPEMLIAGKTASQRSAIPGEAGLAEQAGPSAYPIAQPAQAALLTRPVYPFPAVAHYSGSGDRNNPANYLPRLAAVRQPQVVNSRAERLFGAGNQAFYRVVNGRLVKNRSVRTGP